MTPHTITIIPPVQKAPLQGSSIELRAVTVRLAKLVLANFDTEGTTNRSPCNTMDRSPVAHGIGAHCTHFWSVGPGVQHARPMSSNNLQKLAKNQRSRAAATSIPKPSWTNFPHFRDTHRQTPYDSMTPHTITIIFSVQNGPLQGSSIELCAVTVMLQKLVLANFDTEGTTNRSPCNTMHRSPVAHGIGAHCTHFWSVGPGVQRARPMSSNNLQKLAKN